MLHKTRILWLAGLPFEPGRQRRGGAAPPSAPQGPMVVLVTHPRAAVVHYYTTLVKQGVIKVDHLQFVASHHSSETEDYSDAADYLKREHIDYFRLQTVDCPLNPQNPYADSGCREAFADLVKGSSGAILNGGPDIPPVLYGQPTLLTTVIARPRTGTSLSWPSGPPIGHPAQSQHRSSGHRASRLRRIGHLRGHADPQRRRRRQPLPDIPSEIYGEHTLEQVQRSNRDTWHRNSWASLDPEPVVAAGVFHPIHLTLQAPTALRLVASSKLVIPRTVMSIHHQAVKRLGANYQVTATSLDGKVIEGIRHRTFRNVLGWQFHPERPVCGTKMRSAKSRKKIPTATLLTLSYRATRSRAISTWPSGNSF